MSRLVTSIHGRRLGLDKDNKLIVPNDELIGEHGAQVASPSTKTLAIFDDFLGAVIHPAYWNLNKGSDGSAANFAISAGAANGQIVGSTGAGAAGTEAVNGVIINAGLNFQWQAPTASLKYAEMVSEARFKVSAITNISVFFGFTNTITLQAPAVSSGAADGITNTANDAVGFLFDTTMTTKKLWLVGSAAGVQATSQNSGIAPVAATFITLRVEVDRNGNAHFYINGTPIGQLMAGAVAKNVLLTPVLNVFTKTAAAQTVNVDYINVSGDRV